MNNVNDDSAKYFDFSEDEDIVNGYYMGGNAEEWRRALAENMQRCLRRQNPTSAIKELIAWGIGAQTHQYQTIWTHFRIFARVLLFLLALNSVLLGILVAKSY